MSAAGIVTDVTPDGIIGIEFGAASMNLDEPNHKAEIFTDSEDSSTAAEIKNSWNAALAELYRRHPDAVLDPEPDYDDGLEVFRATWPRPADQDDTSHERDHSVTANTAADVPYAYTVINGRLVYLHEFIMGSPPRGHKIVHLDGNTVDNRGANLAFVPEDDPRPAAPLGRILSAHEICAYHGDHMAGDC